jgi:Tfp pilus assembly protein PilX
MKVGSKTLQEVEAALREYEKEVQASNLTPSTKHTYLLHSDIQPTGNNYRTCRADMVATRLRVAGQSAGGRRSGRARKAIFKFCLSASKFPQNGVLSNLP